MLETTWFLLWGLLWVIYFILDGFDLGAGMLLPFLARNEKDRRAVYQAIGPYWDGNEVWLITAGGVTFAAFPGAYAVMFSALYSPLMLILFGLIIRGASLAFREEVESRRGRGFWDWGFVLGSFVPAVLLGVAFANIFRGVPLDSAGRLEGNILSLLNLYGIAGGVLFVVFFLEHGALWLVIKTRGPVRTRAAEAVRALWIALTFVAVVFLVLSAFMTGLYANYLEHPALFLIPLAAVAGLVWSRVAMGGEHWTAAWVGSSVFIAGAALFGVVGIYPALLPSSLDPAYSVTIAKSASSPLTLKIMLTVVLVFVPLVVAYQAWTFWLFKEKVDGTEEGDEGGY